MMYVQIFKLDQCYLPLISIISIQLFLLIHIPFHHAIYDNENYYSDCSNKTIFKCGRTTLTAIYPFWVEKIRPSYCGLEGFKLSCENNETPVIDIGSDTKYGVVNITIFTSVITLQRHDYHLDGTCSPKIRTTKLNSKLFEYSQGVENLYMFYGCPRDLYVPVTFGFRNNFTCKSDDQDKQVIFGLPSFLKDRLEELHRSCTTPLEVPVKWTDLEKFSSNVPVSLEEILKSNFDVHYMINTQACIDCWKNGGMCWNGTDIPEVNPDCLFPGNNTKGSEAHKVSGPGDTKATQPRNTKASKLKIGIAVGVAGGGMLLFLLVILIVYHRKKAKHASSHSFSMYNPEKGETYIGVPTFSYKELESATNNFDSRNELGNGAFGTVYKGKLRDGREVAVKRLYENNFKRVEQFMNEIVILTRLQHPNLVVLYGSTSHLCKKLLLVYEYIPNGTIAEHLSGDGAKPGSLAWKTRMSIAMETASALSYLHVSDVIHRDVKTTNILLDNNFHVKVADFGLSRLFPMNVTHVSTVPQGTPGYVDPEYHQCYQLTDKSDVYSFGVVLIEIISSKPAVDINRHRQEINLANLAINKIQGGALHELVDPTLGFELDDDVRMMVTDVAELAFRCLQNERELRPSMEEVHKSLEEIHRKYYGDKK